MLYTNEKKHHIIKDVDTHQPLMVGNHAAFKFTIRHLYHDTKNGIWRAGKSGITLTIEDVPILLASVAAFYNMATADEENMESLTVCVGGEEIALPPEEESFKIYEPDVRPHLDW